MITWKWSVSQLVAYENGAFKHVILDTNGSSSGPDAEEEALMAAAPEMYEALKAAVKTNMNYSKHTLGKHELELIYKAIAKAEGHI